MYQFFRKIAFPLVLAIIATTLVRPAIAGDISVEGEIESRSGGIRFPDNTLQTTAGQPPISGECPHGQVISSINADGSITCAFLNYTNRPNLFWTLESGFNQGTYTSIAVGVDGFPIISFHDDFENDLEVVHCLDTSCLESNQYTIDGVTDNVGDYGNIAIGWRGNPYIAYYDATNTALKLARCNDVSCSTSTTYTVDDSELVGGGVRMAVPGDQKAVMVYFDAANSAIKYARCTASDYSCSLKNINTVVTVAETPGIGLAIAINSDGNPIISFRNNTTGILKVLHCNNLDCSSSVTNPIESAMSGAIAVGADGLPVLAYRSDAGVLTVAHCDDISCTSSSSVVVDTADPREVAMAIGFDGMPVISYRDQDNTSLKVAHCRTLACTSADVHTIDNTTDTGRYSSIAIGFDGLPVISYHNSNAGDLEFVKCGRIDCRP